MKKRLVREWEARPQSPDLKLIFRIIKPRKKNNETEVSIDEVVPVHPVHTRKWIDSNEQPWTNIWKRILCSWKWGELMLLRGVSKQFYDIARPILNGIAVKSFNDVYNYQRNTSGIISFSGDDCRKAQNYLIHLTRQYGPYITKHTVMHGVDFPSKNHLQIGVSFGTKKYCIIEIFHGELKYFGTFDKYFASVQERQARAIWKQQKSQRLNYLNEQLELHSFKQFDQLLPYFANGKQIYNGENMFDIKRIKSWLNGRTENETETVQKFIEDVQMTIDNRPTYGTRKFIKEEEVVVMDTFDEPHAGMAPIVLHLNGVYEEGTPTNPILIE